MSEWWTYSLTDFLLFAPRTYYRLFELYNEAVWPAHIAAIVLGLAILAFARGGDGRSVATLLAIAWAWVAVAFHLERYSTINWAATYAAAAFALQAVLLVASGGVRNALAYRGGGRLGLLIFAFALVVQPFVGLAFGRDWRQAEVFGLAPDPTALATVGIVLFAERIHWHLLAIPFLWCAFTGLTLLAMEAPDAFVTPALATLALVLAAWKTLQRRRGQAAA
jgi:hypothetical protein